MLLHSFNRVTILLYKKKILSFISSDRKKYYIESRPYIDYHNYNLHFCETMREIIICFCFNLLLICGGQSFNYEITQQWTRKTFQYCPLTSVHRPFKDGGTGTIASMNHILLYNDVNHILTELLFCSTILTVLATCPMCKGEYNSQCVRCVFTFKQRMSSHTSVRMCQKWTWTSVSITFITSVYVLELLHQCCACVWLSRQEGVGERAHVWLRVCVCASGCTAKDLNGTITMRDS